MVDTYEKYNLEGIESESLTFKCLQHLEQRIEIHLSCGRAGVVQVHFATPVCYRAMDEMYRHRSWRSCTFPKASVFRVKESTWLKWLSEESDGVLQASELTHYFFTTDSVCVDIASHGQPTLVY